MPRELMHVWSIFDHPLDYPHHVVARRAEIGHGPEPLMTNEVLCADTIEPLRDEMMRRGLICVPRDPTDPPFLVESWM
jgi:hypothetical protein